MIITKVYDREDWWQARIVVDGKTYIAFANTEEKAKEDLIAQLEKDGHVKSPYQITSN